MNNVNVPSVELTTLVLWVNIIIVRFNRSSCSWLGVSNFLFRKEEKSFKKVIEWNNWELYIYWIFFSNKKRTKVIIFDKKVIEYFREQIWNQHFLLVNIISKNEVIRIKNTSRTLTYSPTTIKAQFVRGQREIK